MVDDKQIAHNVNDALEDYLHLNGCESKEEIALALSMLFSGIFNYFSILDGKDIAIKFILEVLVRLTTLSEFNKAALSLRQKIDK